MKRYIYIGVRTDISSAQQVVQACHAALEAGESYLEDFGHPSVVVLGFKTEAKLKKFQEYLDSIDWMHYDAWHEPALNNELTSIATMPVPEDERKLFKKFQLLR